MDLGEDELYRRLARPAVRPKAQPLVQYLLEHRWEPIVRSGGWEQLLDVWKDGIALNPREFPDWQELDVLRATRHSIVIVWESSRRSTGRKPKASSRH